MAGTHGKTSTTSMLTVALQHCGLDPSFAIGGDLTTTGAGAHHGAGDVFVVEADESDGSFTAFAPDVAVITNVEPDHLDHHGTEEAYRAVFAQFVDRIRPGGTLIACTDDPGVVPLVARARDRGLTVRCYGHAESSDAVLLEFIPAGAGARVRARLGGDEVVLRLAVPGEHMALNALGAALAAVEMGAHRDCLTEGLAAFDGVRRRFEYKGRAGGVAVYDDYAHHPTEVDATLRAALEVAGRRPGRRRLPTAPLLPDPDVRRRLRRRVGPRRRGRGPRRLRRPRRPRAGRQGALVADAVPLPSERVHLCRGGRRCPRCWRVSPARATWCSRWARAM